MLGDARPVRRGRARLRAGRPAGLPVTAARAGPPATVLPPVPLGTGLRAGTSAGDGAADGSAGDGSVAGRSRGRCCRGFRTVLVCGVEPSAVRLRARVLLRHGRLPPPARHDGGRPAAAGPRSAGRRRSMRTVATWDSNSSAPGPKQLRAARRPERWFCRDEPTTPLPSVCDLPGGRSAAAGRRGRAHRDGQVRPRRRARRGPGRGGRQRGRDGPLPGDGRRHGQARPRRARAVFRTTCSTSWTSPRPPPSRPTSGRRGRSIEDLRGAGRTPVLVGGSGLYVQAVVDELEFPGTDPVLRAELEAELAAVGPAALHTRLAAVDPAAAAAVLPSNGRRIVRALEVVALTGRPFPRPARDGRAAALRRRAARRGPARRASSTSGSPAASPGCSPRPGRGDPRAARPRPARGPHRLPGARLPAGRRRARRRVPYCGGPRRGRGGHGARHPAVRPPAALLVPPRPPHRLARPGAGPARAGRLRTLVGRSMTGIRVHQGPRHRERLRRPARPRRRARPDRRPGRRALRPPSRARRGRRAAGGPVGGARRTTRSPRSPASSGSWTTATRTASIAEMCGNGVRVFAHWLDRAGWLPEADVLRLGTRAGVREVRFTGDGGGRRHGPRPASARRRTPTVGGADVRRGRRWTSATRTSRASTDVALDALDLTVAPGYDRALFPHGVNIEFVTPVARRARWRCGCTSAGWGRRARAAPAPSPRSWPRCAPRARRPATSTCRPPADGCGSPSPPDTTVLHGPAVLVASRRAGRRLVGRPLTEDGRPTSPESARRRERSGGSMPLTMTELSQYGSGSTDRLPVSGRAGPRGARLAPPRGRPVHRARRRHRGRVPAAPPGARRARRRVDRGQRRAGPGLADRAGPARRDRRLAGARRPDPAPQPPRPRHLHRLRQGRRAAATPCRPPARTP